MRGRSRTAAGLAALMVAAGGVAGCGAEDVERGAQDARERAEDARKQAEEAGREAQRRGEELQREVQP